MAWRGVHTKRELEGERKRIASGKVLSADRVRSRLSEKRKIDAVRQKLADYRPRKKTLLISSNKTIFCKSYHDSLLGFQL